ncbi:hypothetical protein M595_3163 [Lyngbya aestuarii BL J]|uniref:Uncharacterized protein n=1 Tax=Lyngbya aestuarii BL J TaxID=1348334 RepID=U7QIL7_9CYAN|nr:hypothetical protein M595_3163 [Lyngbya aestuarii BL J]
MRRSEVNGRSSSVMGRVSRIDYSVFHVRGIEGVGDCDWDGEEWE